MADAIAALARAQRIEGLDELVGQLPAVAVRVDGAIAAPPARDWNGVVKQLQRVGFSGALTERVMALTEGAPADFLARDALLRSLFREDAIVDRLAPHVARTRAWFARSVPPSVCVAPREERGASAPSAAALLPEVPLALLPTDDEAQPSLDAGLVGAAALFERAYATSLATLWLRSLTETRPAPAVWHALVEVCADQGVFLFDAAERTERPWVAAYLGIRAADRTFALGIETDEGGAARRSLHDRLTREIEARSDDDNDDALCRKRPELVVAWARSSVGQGERDLARQAALVERVCGDRPAWRYAAETQLLLASRVQSPQFAAKLAAHVRGGGARAELFIDLLMVQPLEWSQNGERPPGYTDVATRLLSELQGRPWALGLWNAARFLLPTPAARRTWAESIFRAHGRQWARALAAWEPH